MPISTTSAPAFPPRVSLSEIKTKEIIGQGEFGLVLALQNINLDSSNPCSDPEEEKARQTLGNSNMHDDQTGESRYAVKKYNPKVINYIERKGLGLKVLAVEAAVLCMADHPNVIKVRALGQCDNALDPDFFFIMDRLKCTLAQKMYKEWYAKYGKANKFTLFRRKKQARLREELMVDRLCVARDIASAMVYLHGRNIIYRDMKPENIGFDCNGVLKLFDFGQAREMPDKDQADEEGTYKLTGLCGSRRYMSPENLLKKRYNLTADSYSFGILLWEMMALAKPFHGMGKEDHERYIAVGKERPGIPSSWPESARVAIEACWSDDYRLRPQFTELLAGLDSELESGAYKDVVSDGFLEKRERDMLGLSLHSSTGTVHTEKCSFRSM
eukprot:CAMPEP_0196812552 /NCGR_PEP_ID=MMETSP1362-20130617/28023_1 /TAXON_ID=163516 /ORGANISM="Leptocylindrus danicus, Strain CCMP1856" /LENGTH=384 /DNA_ID=CAMNT_0042188287 /DNA_START=73 /DNA_END=1227 /DNA_ORIENTATION=+